MKNGEVSFEKFEKSIINKLLEGTDRNKKILKQQYDLSIIKKENLAARYFSFTLTYQ